MSESILRLRVQSDEYNNKLKQATEQLARYADGCRKAGGTLQYVDDNIVEFTRSLGRMETTATTARGKVAELTKSYTELAVRYKNMTDEEKKGEYGKALSASLDELKGRIQEGKVQLDDINKSINGGGGLTGALDAVAGKFGLSIDQVTKFGGVVGVATTAVQVAKDAFFQSESGIDEWGRTVEGAKGAYSVFLDTLNNGNWSNFFQNLSAAIRGGRDLYDVFDRLGSIKSNNAAAIAITQKEIAELRLAKQQGENVDAKLKSATERLAALQKQSVSAGMSAGSQSAFQTIRNGVNSVGGASINDATIKYAVDRIMKGGQAEFDKYKRNYEILQQKGTRTTVIPIDDGMGGTVNKYQSSFDINLLTKEQQKQYALAKAITEGETRIQAGISAYAQAVSEGTASAREEFKGNRYALQGAGGGVSTSNTRKTTSQETAANKVKEAERTYAETLMKNSIRLEAGMDTTLEYKKRELSAQERLFDAYNDAYATYQDPSYKKASTEAAEKIRTLAGEVKAASDAQEAAMKSARELDAAQRKLADAQQKLAEARATGSATAVYQAQQEVDKRQKVVEQVQYVADVKAGKMPTLPENMKAEMVVTANTDEAVRALRAIQGIKIDSKSFTVITDDADAMARLREIRGIKIAPKSFTVSTDDADAMARLREIDGVTIDDKTFSVSVNDADTLAKVREIAGVTIDDKTMTVTATTDEAVRALQAIQGVMIHPKSFDISTDNAEALAKVSEIDGVTIGQKTFTVTADDEDVLAKLREILDKLSEIQGVAIDTKTFTISTDNEEALAKVREIQDLTIDPKTVKIVQDVSTQGEKSSFDNLVETVQAEIKFDQMKVDETALHTLLQTALQNGLDNLTPDYAGLQERIAKGIDIPDSTWEELTNEINDKLKDLGIEPIQIPVETVGKDVKAITQAARTTAEVVGSIGDAFNAIEDPAAKVMGTVMQAIASVALGYAQATVEATSMGPWAWVAFAATGLATMLSTISAIHSATGYAQGGIVKGNSYSGDNIYGGPDAMVNAGELVLTKAQQSTLASQLQEGGMRNMNLSGRIRGTDIILSVDRTLSLEGKQLLTWGR